MTTKAALVKTVEDHLARIKQTLDAERAAMRQRLKEISPAYSEKLRTKLWGEYTAKLAEIDARNELITFDYLYARAAALHPGLKDDA
jgi:hypothetical protein